MAANADNSKPNGVYKNRRLMHASTTIVGYTVNLQTKDGSVWEGIFNTFSSEFTICLDLAVQIDPKLNSKDCLYAALKGGSQAKKSAFFDLKDIVRVSVADVDLNYATKDMAKLATDADISGYDANKSSSGEQRQLESWQDDDGDNANADTMLSLDDVALTGNKNDNQGNSHRWDPHDMFRYNEQYHKVTTTYDEKLTDYTVPLPKHNTKEWRKKQERASAIAKEIESNAKSQIRLAKEDEGDCEEEKFSAVLRPVPQNRSHTSSVKSHGIDTTDNISQQRHSEDHISKQSPGTHQVRVPSDHQNDKKSSNSPIINNNTATTSISSTTTTTTTAPTPNSSHQTTSQVSNPKLTREDKVDDDNNKYNNSVHRPLMNRGLNSGNQNGSHKNFRPRAYDKSRMDSLKNFGKQLNLGPSPRQSQNMSQMQNSPALHQQQQSQQKQHQHQPPQVHQQSQQPSSHQSHQHQQHHHQQQQHPPPHQHQQQQQPQQPQTLPHQQQHQSHTHQPHPPPTQAPLHQQPQSTTQNQQPLAQSNAAAAAAAAASPAVITASPTTVTNTVSERSDANALSSQSKDHQSELARKSKLNPNAKEFVYKPRSPAIQGNQTNGANQTPTGGPTLIDPTSSSPMSQTPHASYYQQVPMFPHGLSPHQQQHHAAQFMQNHAHPHFQNQIHYMSAVPPHFAQQMSQRFIRSNFQGYHHRGEHHNNPRPDYTQASMMAPTSTGQAFVASPTGAPHPMNAYAASPQQPMIYGAPPQSMYPVVQAGFSQHMSHVMPNPPPYDGSTVYMPSQNYIVNP